MKLTVTAIRALTLPEGMREKTYFDDDLAGFGVRARAGGSKRYVVQYSVHGHARRIVLGTVTALDLGRARVTAKEILARVRLGEDPAQDRSEARARTLETFAASLPRYLAHKQASVRKKTYGELTRHLQLDAKTLHPRPIAVLAGDHRACAILLADIAAASGSRTANCVRASLSAYFGWLLREGLAEANPITRTNRAVERAPRDRVFTLSEWRAVWAAAGDEQFGSIVKLLALTGCRRSEIGDLHWTEIDFAKGVITLRADRVKNNIQHEIPMSRLIVDILQAQPRRSLPDSTPRDLVFGFGAGGFSGWDVAKRALDARIAAQGQNISPWNLHDIRRSVVTGMHEIGIMPHVVEAVVNHVGGQSRVARTYNRASYLAEKSQALARWADDVMAVVEGHQSKVVSLARA